LLHAAPRQALEQRIAGAVEAQVDDVGMRLDGGSQRLRQREAVAGRAAPDSLRQQAL
jgi:hypothetical protein